MRRKNSSKIKLFFLLLLVCLISFSLLRVGASAGSPKKKVSPFGIHGVGLPFFKQVGDLDCSIVRIIISTPVWDMIENGRGLDFSKMDAAVRTLQEQGLDIVFTIMPNSKRWGSPDLFKSKGSKVEPTIHADYPVNFDLYKKTLNAIVERYDGDGKEDMPNLAYSIDYYQLVNEWIWQWEGTEEEYLKYLIDSRKIIKEAHQGARIILGGLTGVEFWAISEGVDKNREVKLGGMLGKDDPEFMSFDSLKRQKPGHVEKMIARIKYILKHGKPYFDIIDFHSYTESYREMIPSIEIIRKNVPDKEIWSLESAGPFYRYSPEKQCQELIKRYIVGLHYGVSKIFWSSYNPTGGWSKNFLNLSLLTKGGQKKPAYFVYKFMAYNFSDVRSVEKMDLGPGIHAYKVFLRNHDIINVVWSDKKGMVVNLPFEGPDGEVPLITFTMRFFQRIQKVEKNVFVRDNTVKVEISDTPVFVSKIFKHS